MPDVSSLSGMYSLSSGTEPFFEFLEKFENDASELVNLEEIKTIGVIMGAANGLLGISFETTLKPDGMPVHDNPAEMTHSFVTEGNETSPVTDWGDAGISGDPIAIGSDKTVTIDLGTYMFSEPIFDAVCQWLEEYFSSARSKLKPAWILVDEADAGIFRMWRPSDLASG